MAHSAAAEQAGRQGSSPGAEDRDELGDGHEGKCLQPGAGRPEASLGKDLNEALVPESGLHVDSSGWQVRVPQELLLLHPAHPSLHLQGVDASRTGPRLSLVPTAPHLPGKSEQELWLWPHPLRDAGGLLALCMGRPAPRFSVTDSYCLHPCELPAGLLET